MVHATQFFEFIRSIANVSTVNGVVRVPPVKFQPMAAGDVANALCDAALSQPVNGTIEIGGPQVFVFDDAVRRVLEFDHDSRQVIGDPEASYYGVQVTENTLVPGADAKSGSITLDWWLAHVPAPGVARKEPVPQLAH